MLREIKISELQFHLRNENCKVYSATINELPFYLCLKHDDRKIYDEYFYTAKKNCNNNYTGASQHYEHFCNLSKDLKINGWCPTQYITISKNPTGKWARLNKTHMARDCGLYRVDDAMHRLSILYFLYGDICLKLIDIFTKRRGYYQPIIEGGDV